MKGHFTSNTESVLFGLLTNFPNDWHIIERHNLAQWTTALICSFFPFLGEQRKGCQSCSERALIGDDKKLCWCVVKELAAVRSKDWELQIGWTGLCVPASRYTRPSATLAHSQCQPAAGRFLQALAGQLRRENRQKQAEVSGFLALQCLGFQSFKDRHRVQENCIKCKTSLNQKQQKKPGKVIFKQERYRSSFQLTAESWQMKSIIKSLFFNTMKTFYLINLNWWEFTKWFDSQASIVAHPRH